MKYGETTFDILYLLFAISSGIIVLLKRKDSIGRLMGFSALILGCGDAFHLIPRVLNYFVDKDFTAWLGFGKLVTSITMTVFYILIFFLHTKLYEWADKKEKNLVMIAMFISMCCRIMICMAPGNHWLTGESSVIWGVLRNVPFLAIGLLIVVIYFQKRNVNSNFKRMWLYVTLSFLFYMPVATIVSIIPMLGMLMIPKTICYILILVIFIKEAFKPGKLTEQKE